VASLSQGRTAAAQCGLFTYKSVPVIFEPPCILNDHYFFYYVTGRDNHFVSILWSTLWSLSISLAYKELN